MNLKGLLVAAFYGFMSIASVFVNKAIFQVYNFKHPYTLVLGQTTFTLVLLLVMRRLHVIRLAPFQFHVLQRVFLLSFAFLLKLLLDMAALSRVNIPMYGVLKSSTTPFVLLLDYLLRSKAASVPIQLSVFLTTAGGFIAGVGDLTFDLPGYVLALSSAMATAAYVVIVGKLGEELHLDSFTLLLYNNVWSLPFALLLVIWNQELPAVMQVVQPKDTLFLLCFLLSCASAFILNLATYLCTLINDSLTTSVVGRLKSIFQGLGGLFAFGDVLVNPTNLIGLLVNSCGIGWYAAEKYRESRSKALRHTAHKSPQPGAKAGDDDDDGKDSQGLMTLTRDGSQVSLVYEDHPHSDVESQRLLNGRR